MGICYSKKLPKKSIFKDPKNRIESFSQIISEENLKFLISFSNFKAKSLNKVFFFFLI